MSAITIAFTISDRVLILAVISVVGASGIHITSLILDHRSHRGTGEDAP